jgi:hypothetical protein
MTDRIKYIVVLLLMSILFSSQLVGCGKSMEDSEEIIESTIEENTTEIETSTIEKTTSESETEVTEVETSTIEENTTEVKQQLKQNHFLIQYQNLIKQCV